MSLVHALQRTLAAEHAAVHVFGALGARTSAEQTPELFAAVSDAYARHRAQRDQLVRDLLDLGEVPVASAAAYELPGRIGTERALSHAALALEGSCAATYAFLVASSQGPQRRWAVNALTESAVRELAFRGTPEMFPGAGEHANR